MPTMLQAPMLTAAFAGCFGRSPPQWQVAARRQNTGKGNGDRDRSEDRFYFAAPYRSWHLSPSQQHSEIPLIVASSTHSAAEIGAYVGKVLGDRLFQQKLTYC